MTIESDYKILLKKIKEVEILSQVQRILGWDQETYMPPKGIKQRSLQNALISSIRHEKFTDPKIGELLKDIKDDPEFTSLNEIKKRNIILIERDYNREIRVPSELVAEIAKQTSIALNVWQKAKNESNFSLFKPELEKVVKLVIKRAKAIDDTKEPFNVLLEENDYGMTSSKLTKMFNELKEELIPLIQNCVNSPRQPDLSILKHEVPLEIQRKISEDLANFLEYNLERGNIAEVEHPFTSGSLDDVRITTHYYEHDVLNSFFSVAHEAGHGMYELEINKDYAYQPVGESVSAGLHESQSRCLENNICRSREFWGYYLPKFKELTGKAFIDLTVDQVYHAVNRAALTPIRVSADELTYNLHIILRFEIERDLLSEKIAVDDLPQIWNKKVKEYLGLDINHDSEGVLQDVHWSAGYFGGFPSYALGNVYAAQFMAALSRDIPDYKSQIREGNLSEINNWLNVHVRQHGSVYDPDELVEKATGEKPNVKYLLSYLKEKFEPLYGLG